MMDWAERYRPRTLAGILGNPTAMNTIRSWARSWSDAVPKKKALILSGPPGIGKTSAAYALAHDMGWEVIELNASDARNEEAINRVATSGAIHQTFSGDGSFIPVEEGGRKLIIFDEADSLFEQKIGGHGEKGAESADLSDRGGKKAIIDTVRATNQPVILIVNDLYGLTGKGGSALKFLCDTVRFSTPKSDTVKKILMKVIKEEGKVPNMILLDAIAQNSGGDVRGALNDLQSAYEGNSEAHIGELKGLLSKRDTKNSIFDSLRNLFRADTAMEARQIAMNAEESSDMFMLWINENLPRVYTDPDDLVRAFGFLSRADIYTRRVKRRQYYRLMAYSREILSGGTALAGRSGTPRPKFVRFQFPTYLKAMSRTKADRLLAKTVNKKLGGYCHTSPSVVKETILPLYRVLLKDHDLAANTIRRLDLNEAELLYILHSEVLPEGTKAALDEIESLRKEDRIKRGKNRKAGKQAPKGTSPLAFDKKNREAVADMTGAGGAGKENSPENEDGSTKDQRSLFDFG